jgi:hypothetical protein
VLVFVVLVFDESEHRLLGFMVPVVLAKHGAVWGAEMAHPTKLPGSSPEAAMSHCRG